MAEKKLGKKFEDGLITDLGTVNGKEIYKRIPIRRKRPEDILAGNVEDGEDIISRLSAVAAWYDDFASKDDNLILYTTLTAWCISADDAEYAKALEDVPYEISDIDMTGKGVVIDHLLNYNGLARAYTEDTWKPEMGIDQLLYWHKVRQVLKWLSQYFRLVTKPGVEIEETGEFGNDDGSDLTGQTTLFD